MIIRMRSDVIAQVISSDVTVTTLMMVVQGGGYAQLMVVDGPGRDAYLTLSYVTAKTTVVIGRMKSIV